MRLHLLLVACLLDASSALALRRRAVGGAPKKKKKVAKLPPPPRGGAAPPPRPATPEGAAPPSGAHLAAVKAAVETRAKVLCDALEDGHAVVEGFLSPTTVAALLAEARSLDARLVPSQSTRWNGTDTVAFDKDGVRSYQILGGDAYDDCPRLTEYVVSLTRALAGVVNDRPSLRKLSTARQTNKLAVCDAVGASYPKHVDNGGGGDPRLLTAIVYLAAPPAGGAFRAYAPTADACAEVAPRPGTLVAFWADRLVHDVAAVEKCRGPDDARWALTVWLCAEDAAVVEPTPPAVLAHHFPGD